MRTWIVCLLVVVLTGCVSFAERFAYLSEEPPCGASPNHVLTFYAPNGEWQGAPYGWVQTAIEFRVLLPERPGNQGKYTATQIALTPAKDLKGQDVTFDSGYISIDREKKKITVALHTPQGDFWANGTYPLD